MKQHIATQEGDLLGHGRTVGGVDNNRLGKGFGTHNGAASSPFIQSDI